LDLHLLSALFGIIWVDLVLAGDNAVVVGMAAAGLPREQRTKVIVIGIAAATLLRVTFAFFTTQLMDFISLIILGGVLLLWVSWKLWRELREQAHEDKAVEDLEAEFRGEPEGNGVLGLRPALASAPDNGAPRKTFTQAVVQIVLADVSMSLDNVIAVGSIAHSHPTWVLVVGLVLSVAFMGIAATLIAGLLKKYRWIGYVGLAIILYVAVHMIYMGSVMAKECMDSGKPLGTCLMQARNPSADTASPMMPATEPAQ
jgi:YjbE family integral membrane protein